MDYNGAYGRLKQESEQEEKSSPEEGEGELKATTHAGG